MSRTEIKLTAKAEFKEHWGVLLLVLALHYVATCLAFVLGFGVGYLIVAGPLLVGIYYVYLNAIQNKSLDWKDMFYGFKTRFGDSFLVWILVWAIITIANAILVIAGLIISALIGRITYGVSSIGDPYGYSYYGYPGAFSSALMGIGSSLFAWFLISIAIMVVLILIAIRFAEAPFLLLKEPEIRPVDALRKSRIMMKGRTGRLFVFDLTFIGWFILVLLTFGLLIIYVGPYYMYARTMLLNQFYDERHGVSADDDEDLQRLNAMKASVRNRTGAVADKIKEKKAEHDAARDTVSVYEQPVQFAEPGPVEEPADFEEAIPVENPVEFEEPVEVEEPVRFEEPAEPEEPVRFEEPAEEVPVGFDEPVTAEEPSAEEGPIEFEGPVDFEEPVHFEEPATEEPVQFEEPAPPNVCWSCGAKLPEGAMFCGKCGKRQ